MGEEQVSQNPPKKWYKTPVGILILLILWPFFLTYWIWKRNWDKQVRVGLIAVLWGFILITTISYDIGKKSYQEAYKKGYEEGKSVVPNTNLNPSSPTPIPTSALMQTPTPSPASRATVSTPKLTEKPVLAQLSGTSEIIESHCQTQWPNDASMKSYCIRQQNEAVEILNKGKPQHVTDEEFNTIRTHCGTKWPTDFEMRAYCEKQQYEAISNLNLNKPNYVTDEEYSIVSKHCESKWPTDFEMKDYCQKQQFQAITTLHLGKPADISETDFNNLRARCTSKWPDDFEMRVYCEQNER